MKIYGRNRNRDELLSIFIFDGFECGFVLLKMLNFSISNSNFSRMVNEWIGKEIGKVCTQFPIELVHRSFDEDLVLHLEFVWWDLSHVQRFDLSWFYILEYDLFDCYSIPLDKHSNVFQIEREVNEYILAKMIKPSVFSDRLCTEWSTSFFWVS